MKRSKKIFIFIGIIVIIAAGLAFGIKSNDDANTDTDLTKVENGVESQLPVDQDADDEPSVKIELREHIASKKAVSSIYAINGTEGEAQGVKSLIQLMGKNNLKFYNSTRENETSGKNGLIGNEDVVLLKINCQWNYRGGTNTDLVKSVIQAILNHPDGFKGEIIVADNGQDQYGGRKSGGSMDWITNNAKDRSQSIQKVVDEFSDQHKVSTYLWDDITKNQVKEYLDGDYTDGFILFPEKNPRTGIIVSYPKFKTKYGTYVSFKEGIWNDTDKKYDESRLKVINMPVLKSHMIYQITASIKNYMGTTSDKLTEHNAHNCVGLGGMGTQMVETRMPTLNILDCIWVNPIRGPMTPDSSATQTNIIAASTDPAALDYWAAKTIFHDSKLKDINVDDNTPGTFGYWLRLSMEEIKGAGYPTTLNMEEMNVYVENKTK